MKPSYPYKRKIIYADKQVEIILITWPPKVRSVAHDHGISTGLIRVLKGKVFQEVYSKKTKKYLKRLTYTIDQTFQETPDIIHIMGNASSTGSAQTLHIYTPPLMMTPYTSEELKAKKSS